MIAARASRPNTSTKPRASNRAGFFRLGLTLGTLACASGCIGDRFLPTSGPCPAPDPGVEVVNFTARDGVRLEGRFYPAGTAADGSPSAPPPREADGGLVLFFHGVNDHAESNMAWWLRDAGFRVFQFDYRGFGNSDRRPTLNHGLIADAEAALEFVRSRPDVDPDRIVLYGHSLGGIYAMAAAAAAERQRRPVRAVVSASAFSSWNRIANTFLPVIVGLFGGVSGPTPIDLARGLGSTPLLVAHAVDDDVTSVDHAWTLHRAALGAGVPTRMALTPDGGHVWAYLVNEPFLSEMNRFVTTHLAPAVPSNP